jgi:acyl-CoA synthetase (AMP-forming)/AMP-acid ligase II
MVCVDVVMKEGFVFKNEKLKIKSHCRQKLESFKVPTRIIEIDKVLFTNRFKKDRS